MVEALATICLSSAEPSFKTTKAFTLFILFQTWVQPAQGFLIDRMGPRVFTTVAGVLCGVGWTGLALATTLLMVSTLYLLAGLGAALITASVAVPATSK